MSGNSKCFSEEVSVLGEHVIAHWTQRTVYKWFKNYFLWSNGWAEVHDGNDMWQKSFQDADRLLAKMDC